MSNSPSTGPGFFERSYDFLTTPSQWLKLGAGIAVIGGVVWYGWNEAAEALEGTGILHPATPEGVTGATGDQITSIFDISAANDESYMTGEPANTIFPDIAAANDDNYGIVEPMNNSVPIT